MELGLHVAEPGYRTVCYVEREAFAASVLVARMADAALDHAPVWDDVTTFDGRAWRGKVHILTAGYPCQPFSFAGRRNGADDPRHLWPHVERIAREARPEWLFFENVEGHLTLGAAEVFDAIRAMDYTPKAGLFSALETGASHLRRRLFVVAHANEIPLLQQGGDRVCESRPALQERSDAGRQATGPRQGSTHLDADVAHGEGNGNAAPNEWRLPTFAPPPHHFADWGAILGRRPELQPELFGLDDGMADRMDRSDAAGNGVVSLAAAYAWRTLKAAHLRARP
ncbi:DNA cytosine methyltransferase [Notoacmeibacter ruber]|uniref:DNA (cytosine-5-)-methyltransferase n=1 Tax=Notoacmeibacter ruber TaxID=2670375 RepID=A0A3L7JFM6_9HYPH|nr:DNA cytosine methyltransferase [Notoacmeibacter ruber]